MNHKLTSEALIVPPKSEGVAPKIRFRREAVAAALPLLTLSVVLTGTLNCVQSATTAGAKTEISAVVAFGFVIVIWPGLPPLSKDIIKSPPSTSCACAMLGKHRAIAIALVNNNRVRLSAVFEFDRFIMCGPFSV